MYGTVLFRILILDSLFQLLTRIQANATSFQKYKQEADSEKLNAAQQVLIHMCPVAA